MKFFLITTIQLILIYFVILLTSCTKNQEKNLALADKQTLDFLLNYSRFEADDHQKQQADSIGKLLISKPNNHSNRELLRKYIIQVMPDKEYFYSLKNKAEQDNDLTHLGNAHELLAKYYDRIFIKDSTLYNYTKSEMYYRQNNDTTNLLNVLIFKSFTLINDRFYSEAETSILEAISYNGLNKSIKDKFTLTLILGTTLTGLGQYQEANTKIQEALVDLDSEEMLRYYRPENLRALRIMTKQSLIKNYIALQDYEMAKKIAIETIEKDVDLTNLNYRADLTYATLLQVYSQARILSNELDEVEQDLHTSIEIYEKSKVWDELNQVKILLADYYFRLNKNAEALNIIDIVLRHSKSHNLLFQEKEALYLLLSNTTIPLHDHFQRYVEVSELINNEATNISNTFARIKFESDSLMLKNEKLEAQKKIIINISIGAILLISLGFMIHFFRQKSKQLRIVQLLQKDTEKYYDSILAMKQELSLTKSVERKKLAQDLHDGVLNKVFVTRFLLMQLTKEDLESKRNIIVNEITNIETFLREASHLLSRHNDFKTNSFDTLLQDLIDLQNRNKNIDFSLSIDPSINLEKFGTNTKIHLYRILQETLQNTQKYSNANKCSITLKQIGLNNIELCVQDNGIGFNVEDNFQGIGLNNIKERAQIIKAKLSITSKPNKGTIITLVFKE
ncbi:sensor histidine kinase [Myroides sp. LJL116]